MPDRMQTIQTRLDVYALLDAGYAAVLLALAEMAEQDDAPELASGLLSLAEQHTVEPHPDGSLQERL